jgi:hypothetical protein
MSFIKWLNKFNQIMLHGLQEVDTAKYSPSHHIENECGWVSLFNTLLNPQGLRLFMASHDYHIESLKLIPSSVHHLIVPEPGCHWWNSFGLGGSLCDNSHSFEFCWCYLT